VSQGKVYKAPTDAEGYAYSLAICGEIPKAELPSGCQQYAEHPSVVKYKGDNPADCIEIGSIGPCSQGECGMTGAPGAGGGVVVTYTYTYGCKNTFTLTMTPGNAPAPGQVTSNECSYTASWAGLRSKPLPPNPPLCMSKFCERTKCPASHPVSKPVEGDCCFGWLGKCHECCTATRCEPKPGEPPAYKAACEAATTEAECAKLNQTCTWPSDPSCKAKPGEPPAYKAVCEAAKTRAECAKLNQTCTWPSSSDPGLHLHDTVGPAVAALTTWDAKIPGLKSDDDAASAASALRSELTLLRDLHAEGLLTDS
jgi:hypothetical protein